MSESPTSPAYITRSSSPDKSSQQDYQAEDENPPGNQKTQRRSKAIDLIRARTVIRMSPPVSAENSPVKTESPGRSPEVSPTKSPAKCPGSPPQRPSNKSVPNSPSKSPKKTPLKSQKASPARQSMQSGSPALRGQPVQLYKNPVPSLEPSPMPNPEKEQSAASSGGEAGCQSFGGSYTHPYMLNTQLFPEQDAASAFQPASHVVPVYAGGTNTAQSPVLEFEQVLPPTQLRGGYSSLASFEAEWRANLELFVTASSEESAGVIAEQSITTRTDEGNLATPAPRNLGVVSPETNSTTERSETQDTQYQPLPNPISRRNTLSTKPKLSPIQEISRQDTLSPKSETSSTAITTDPPSPARSIDSGQFFKHASSISTQSSPTPSAATTTTAGTTITRKQKPSDFFYQLDSHGFPCASSTCDNRCNLWDGTSVICPKCGPYSEIRYCSKAHLLEDIKWHWAYCGTMSFEYPCKDSSIPREIRVDTPCLIPCMHGYDTPERHRQAVYFNVCGSQADYFIFSDWVDLMEAGGVSDGMAARCSSTVICTVTFEVPAEKDRFRRVLAACLFLTIEVPDLADYLFRLIRNNLRTKSFWSKSLHQSLIHQLSQELSVQIQPHVTGERHACPTDWDGQSRRACKDVVCRGEYRRLLGKLGGMGFGRLLEHLEAGYWVLRVARGTHPVVKEVEERMRGVGFDGVLEEDRRVFRRGVGWDGVGSGCMEIEGVNV
ncbi:hypothetical protein SI65_00866 [Aspergillus cristatus]|uniref:Uncharacterized protein n=1 Tax=Aspergillus cristatus TaxID=573508 RepID=A0A1E3BQV6_ASPCR|nr:hypothetical protein SI65_00866 [Aspergillus cristatus]